MSWSVSANSVPVKDLAANLKALIDAAPQEQFALPETHEQADAAIAAVVALVEAGVCGENEGLLVQVTLGGHANANHENVSGYVNSGVHVSVHKA